MRILFFLLLIGVILVGLYMFSFEGTSTDPDETNATSSEETNADVVIEPEPDTETFTSAAQSGIEYSLSLPERVEVSEVTGNRYEFKYIGPNSDLQTEITDGYYISSHLSTTTTALAEFATTRAETELQASTTVAGYDAVEYETISALSGRPVQNIAIAVPERSAILNFSIDTYGESASAYRQQVMQILDSLQIEVAEEAEDKSDMIRVDEPEPQAEVSTPLTVTGEARGTWYFEADAPMVLTDWDGRIIAESFVTAEGEWMTEDFVPFTGTIEFESPYEANEPSYMQQGFLILQKSNPSGLPENDAAVEIPVTFAPR